MPHHCSRLIAHARRGVAVLALMMSAAAAHAVEAGDTAPLVKGPLEDGSTFTLESLRGEVVYVDFWASWCAPCRRALPAFDKLYRELGDAGFTVVGVNVDRQRSAALRMLDELSPSFPNVFDPEGQWAARYSLPGMPSGYLIDREGVVHYRHVGYQERDLPKLEQKIRQLLETES